MESLGLRSQCPHCSFLFFFWGGFQYGWNGRRILSLRIACDEAETKTDARAWPFPGYAELLFSV